MSFIGYKDRETNTIIITGGLTDSEPNSDNILMPLGNSYVIDAYKINKPIAIINECNNNFYPYWEFQISDKQTDEFNNKIKFYKLQCNRDIYEGIDEYKKKVLDKGKEYLMLYKYGQFNYTIDNYGKLNITHGKELVCDDFGKEGCLLKAEYKFLNNEDFKYIKEKISEED